jgi:two-component system, OmpR family, alkaline phosphatase synthesis response regulator PhoP
MEPAQSQPQQAAILVVDDNKSVLEFLLLLLSKHGFTVVGASSGQECLDIIATRPISLVILDVMMPLMDGLQVCKQLKNTVPALPIILLTARDDMTTRAAAMDLGVSEFLAKPVNNRELVNRIRTQLHNLEWHNATDQAFSNIDRHSATPPAVDDKN